MKVRRGCGVYVWFVTAGPELGRYDARMLCLSQLVLVIPVFLSPASFTAAINYSFIPTFFSWRIFDNGTSCYQPGQRTTAPAAAVTHCSSHLSLFAAPLLPLAATPKVLWSVLFVFVFDRDLYLVICCPVSHRRLCQDFIFILFLLVTWFSLSFSPAC